MNSLPFSELEVEDEFTFQGIDYRKVIPYMDVNDECPGEFTTWNAIIIDEACWAYFDDSVIVEQ